MEQEKELTGQESLALIAKMISKAKRDYLDTGLSALLWGSVITFCSLAAFANKWLQWPWLDYVWFLTIAAVIPQVVISIREAKARKHRPYDEDLMSGIWIAFTVTVFLFSYILSLSPVRSIPAIYLALYGVPTFTTGYARRFRPMILGGVACWCLAILSLYLDYPYTLLSLTTGAQVAWFIPGLIIRKRYLKATKENV